ncbi:hypothetical protein PanWU01x14_370240 [Parasponia andersonii]|uniref:Uncharacterized protein n=1 Tax=Parasponia andersonii TaxID=3476 RepID=A0A2P5A4D9_PARAD|nr:hypothetical protein PanWU01x14_370240 [Parasponia andersonii]
MVAVMRRMGFMNRLDLCGNRQCYNYSALFHDGGETKRGSYTSERIKTQKLCAEGLSTVIRSTQEQGGLTRSLQGSQKRRLHWLSWDRLCACRNRQQGQPTLFAPIKSANPTTRNLLVKDSILLLDVRNDGMKQRLATNYVHIRTIAIKQDMMLFILLAFTDKCKGHLMKHLGPYRGD